MRYNARATDKVLQVQHYENNAVPQLDRCSTCKSGIYVITQHLPLPLAEHMYQRIFRMYIQRLYNLQLQVTNFVIGTDSNRGSAFARSLAFAIACNTSAACVQA